MKEKKINESACQFTCPPNDVVAFKLGHLNCLTRRQPKFSSFACTNEINKSIKFREASQSASLAVKLPFVHILRADYPYL